MPAERRSLRSNNKSDTSSSANGEKGRSDSQSSGAKDKAPTTRAAAANKAKSAPTKKDAKGASNGGMGEDDKSHTNGSKSTENGVNGSEDVEMGEDTAGAPTSSFNTSKDRKGDEKMTVVVPPTKGFKPSGKDKEDVTMEGAEDGDAENTEPEVDPTTKAIQGS
jgi:DNA-directed RNA polymerase subunit M/transcription elongation factor TFIIS